MRALLAAVAVLFATSCTPQEPPLECVYWHPDGVVTGSCPR